MSRKLGLGVVGLGLGAVAIACAGGSSSSSASDDLEAAKPALVISQVYTHGGESDDGYDSDFVEVLNRGTTPVATKDLRLAYYPPSQHSSTSASSGVVWMGMGDRSLVAGERLLFRITVPGKKGKPLPSFDQQSPQLGPEDGHEADLSASGFLVLGRGGDATSCGAVLTNGSCNAIDLVALGPADHAERSAIATDPDGMALLRAGDGCIDTDDNAADFAPGPPKPRSTKDAPAPACPQDQADASVDAASVDAASGDSGADAGNPAADASAPAADAAAPKTPPKATTPGEDTTPGREGGVITTSDPPGTKKPTGLGTADSTPTAPSATSTCAVGAPGLPVSPAGAVLGLGLGLTAVARRRRK